MENKAIKRYILQLQQIYYGDSWIDEDIEKKLRNINEENAFIKPDGYIHSVAEVVSHLVEWRKELTERLQFGRHAKLTMGSENNWRSNEILKKSGWAYLKEQLDNTQKDLIALIETKDDSFLDSKWSGEYDYDYLLVGLIQHDIYHLGQIGLIYKMITYRSVAN
ncbi:MAG TPA: DinB family protein [Flavitalea sp.]|nr:DinB family protein [Flavitalea sp.]